MSKAVNPSRVVRWCILLALCFANVFIGHSAELVTGEATRLRVLRLLFPTEQISATHARVAARFYTQAWLSELPLDDAMQPETLYDVVGPATKEEEGPAELGTVGGDRFSNKRHVRLRIYRWHSEGGSLPLLVAIVHYSFADAMPSRCCRAVGKLLLLSNDGDHLLDSFDQMPNAFTMFTDLRFLDSGNMGPERFLVSVDFAGAGTVGVNTAVLDLSHRKFRSLLWETTAVYYGLEKEEEEMYTMTLDEHRTLLAKGSRYYFLKKTYIEKGKRFSNPITSLESYPIRKAVPLDWQ